MSNESVAAFKRPFGHAVVDADAHWLEPMPVFLDYLKDEAGADVVQTLRAHYARIDGDWYASQERERHAKRMKRRAWWSEPATLRDRATAMLPGMLAERLPEIGIDYAVVYPTLALVAMRYPVAELRRAACRALNRMNAELFAPYRNRMTVVAAVPVITPEEAIAEARYAREQLGLKAIVIGGTVLRQVEVNGAPRSFVDTLGLDSPHDYDPFWRACLDLGVVVSDHGGAFDWPDRQSVTNFVHNHVGHFANAQHASCRAIVLGGVAKRFERLPFAFLEGGVAWAASLLLGLGEHLEKRNTKAMDQYLRPDNVPEKDFTALYERYATGRMKGRASDVYASLSIVSPFTTPTELSERERDHVDDFAASGITSKAQLRSMFQNQFFFGCEADDRMTSLAFRPELRLALRPLFSSDVGHYDVLDMSEVVGEAWELVEKGLLDEEQFRQFTFDNVVDMHTRLNPHFFDGTAVEAAVNAARGVPA